MYNYSSMSRSLQKRRLRSIHTIECEKMTRCLSLIAVRFALQDLPYTIRCIIIPKLIRALLSTWSIVTFSNAYRSMPCRVLLLSAATAHWGRELQRRRYNTMTESPRTDAGAHHWALSSTKSPALEGETLERPGLVNENEIPRLYDRFRAQAR